MSSDGRTLYFSSTRPGGYGENDIYVTYLTERGWSVPQNLGSIINTPGREEGVFIHPDNQTLYFSSNALTCLGVSFLVSDVDNVSLLIFLLLWF